MGTEVEHLSGDNIQTTLTTPSSTTSTSATKTSMFAKRTGFVIPKNKLSGSLVRVQKGTKKLDSDLVKEEANKKVQRKTKWGPDLTTDPTVKKGRASAYQTRINQISQQLTLGMLELEEDEDSFAASESHQLSHEESELLDLERREIIGELLKLNPTYKAPADYKPLLKEAKVPIPIKEYPGYNFVGLLFDHSSDTQKRLEKETGAKVQVFATKKDTGGKVEITTTDEKEIEKTCEDMYVHVSADTFEKVDAAVALIELLITPVSVNPVSSSTTTTSVPNNNMNVDQSQSRPPSHIAPPPLINQGRPQGNFRQYPQPWFSAGPTQTPAYNNNKPSLFGPQPSFSPVFQNPSSNQPPRNLSMPILPSPNSQPSLNGPPFSSRPPPMSISDPITSHGHGPPMNMNMNMNMNIPRPMPFPPQPRFSGNNTQSFDSVRPVSSDFTFLPHRPPASQLWQGNQSSIRPPQSPLLRPMVHNMNMNTPPRHHQMMGGPAGPHMQVRNFVPPPHQMNPLFAPRQGSQRFPIPQQNFGGRPFFGSSNAQQTYDPFSPTSPSHGR